MLIAFRNSTALTVTATVVSAVELNETEKAALKQRLEKNSGNTVMLECTVDPSILGGLIVTVNGTVTDGSLRHRLREVKDVMSR
jgi:F-type H+-transporting ATPase subunit delta